MSRTQLLRPQRACYEALLKVLRTLPAEQYVQVEQGLLKTFGRIMPVFMTLCVVLAIAYAIQMNGKEGLARGVRWAAAVAFMLALMRRAAEPLVRLKSSSHNRPFHDSPHFP